MNYLLSTEDAYRAMCEFLAAYNRRGPSDDIAALLGSLDLQPDGRPADPAMEGDWSLAVGTALKRLETAKHFNRMWAATDRRTLDALWFSYQHIPGVAFGLNDFVEIISGANASQRGSTMSLLDLRPEPVYLVELESGVDVRISQSSLRAVEP